MRAETIFRWSRPWQSWRELRQHPVYLREKGAWGRPNPFFDGLHRFAPLVWLAAFFLGACTAVANPAFLANQEELGVLLCLGCLPALLAVGVKLYGLTMAPALTAPAISLEVQQGTWEILRATPVSTRFLVLAKLMGALARLRIWTLLLLSTLLQAGMTFLILGVWLSQDLTARFNLPATLTALTLLGRPWLEIWLAALFGLFFSARLTSPTTALVSSYTLLLGYKLLNNGFIWTLVGLQLALEGPTLYFMSGLGPAAVDALVSLVTLTLVVRQLEYVGG